MKRKCNFSLKDCSNRDDLQLAHSICVDCRHCSEHRPDPDDYYSPEPCLGCGRDKTEPKCDCCVTAKERRELLKMAK